MDVATSLFVIALAGIIHSGFQLSVSMLTLISGHSFIAKHSQARLISLTTSFVLGSIVMTILLVSSLAYIFSNTLIGGIPVLWWAISIGLAIGVGVAIWIFYYRREEGTALWIPRPMATYMSNRAKKTNNGGEAFTLGLVSPLAEIIFIIAPALIASLTLVGLAPIWQIAGLIIYTVCASLSLLIVWSLVGSGHSLGRIQSWREENKKFLQFASGASLMVLAFCIYVNEIVAAMYGAI